MQDSSREVSENKLQDMMYNIRAMVSTAVGVEILTACTEVTVLTKTR